MLERFSRLLKPWQKSPEQKLANARRQLDIAWRELGGQDGTMVTKNQIQQLLESEIQLVKTEIYSTSRTEALESAIKLDIEEDWQTACSWLKRQKAYWQKKWLFREGNRFEILEIQRRIIACNSAVELLTNTTEHVPIA